MKELLMQDLKTITEASSAPLVSIYISKENGTLGMKELREKWEISISRVEHFLLRDYSRTFIDSFLEPLRKDNCLESLKDVDRGFIVFYSVLEKGYLKVQTDINDLVVVADSFHIKPLLRIRNTARGFFLITMSSNAINLLVETNGHLYRLETYKKEMLTINSNKVIKPEPKDFIIQTAMELNKMIAPYKLPIILAGVKDLIGHMRKFLDHSMLLEESIVGNVEHLKTNDLRARCFELLEPYYSKKEIEVVKQLDFAIKMNRAITYIEDIAVSAVHGKIKKLFVVENRQVWGRINKSNGEIFVSPKQLNSHDDDILDDICQIVLSRGGEVVVLKDSSKVKGYIAAAIISDRSHLYDYNQSPDSLISE